MPQAFDRRPDLRGQLKRDRQVSNIWFGWVDYIWLWHSHQDEARAGLDEEHGPAACMTFPGSGMGKPQMGMGKTAIKWGWKSWGTCKALSVGFREKYCWIGHPRSGCGCGGCPWQMSLSRVRAVLPPRALGVPLGPARWAVLSSAAISRLKSCVSAHFAFWHECSPQDWVSSGSLCRQLSLFPKACSQ